jgi:uncharacterized cofD-like protein
VSYARAEVGDEERASGLVRVVTLGGGHGQSTLLRALARLPCEVAAVVSIADDGGCSGKLRTELGMAPPGDLRRCLTSLAGDRFLAARFEERLSGGSEEGRSVGNLALAQAYVELGSLQAAVDWAARLLECRGRVLPAAESAGTLAVVDHDGGLVAGETEVERAPTEALVANVFGVEYANPEAVRAVEAADVVFLGPGSFFGSTLAAVTTGDLGAAVARSGARVVFVENVAPEEGQVPHGPDAERVLRDHLVIKSGGEVVVLDVLRHLDGPGLEEHATRRPDGSLLVCAPLAQPGSRIHDAGLLAGVIARHILDDAAALASPPSRAIRPPRDHEGARTELEQRVHAARARLARAGVM